jgi:hypothetical protein
MVASLRGSVGTGTKEDESSTKRVWASGFQSVTVRLAWCAFWKLGTVYFFNFPTFFSGRGKEGGLFNKTARNIKAW